tara:strand:+ start:614 stop:1000 length:387 start_codon:yes stop_codon:yes gene_type:complete
MKDTYYLFKSNRRAKKWVLIMPSLSHFHYFGGVKKDGIPYKDFTLLNDINSIHYEPDEEKRNRKKQLYHKRHANEKGGRHTPSSMSKIILWNKKTLLEGIKDYEKTFNVNVIFKNKVLTRAIKTKLLA